MKVWVLHPKYEGKVVAEAYAGINHKSRCINDVQDLCKKGEQMISIIRTFYKDTPVMFAKDGRFPKHVAFLDQVEGLPNSPILWGVCYIIPIPSLEDVTRMISNVTSAVCGRTRSTAMEQGGERKTPSPDGNQGDSTTSGKVRSSSQSKHRNDARKSSGKNMS